MMRRGAVTTGAAPPADTGPPLTIECPPPCAMLACSKARGGIGAGRDAHQATYDVYHYPHRSPRRPANGEFSPPEALGCRRAPVSAGALNHICTPMPKMGPILTPDPFIWVSSGTLTPSTDRRSSTYRLGTALHSLSLSLPMNPESPWSSNLPSRGPARSQIGLAGAAV